MRWGGWLAPAAALALACAGSPPPEDAFHRLRLSQPAARGAPLLAGTVEVARPDASDLLRGRAIVVAQAAREGRLQRSRYQFWSDPPAVLVQQALADRLRTGGLAARVVTPERRDDPQWVVSGTLHRFERIVGPGGDQAVVRIELALRDVAARRVPVLGVYEARESAADGSVEAAVDAFGRALGDVFARFLADVEAAIGPS